MTWIVGDGPLRPAVEAAVAEAGVGGRVRFLGLRKDIPAVLSASDVLERVSAANAPAFVERLRTQAVDLLVSLACPQILRRDVLSVPPRGAINLHGALLPDYRGLLPAFWVLANGEPHTGATVHYMHEEVDLGPVILQERVPIRPDDTVHTLVQRTKLEVGVPPLVRALEQIEQGADRPTDPRAGRAFGYPDADAIRRFRARGRRFV